MAKKSVNMWMLYGWESYERDSIIAIYDAKKPADDEAKRLSALLEQAPTVPTIEESDYVWDSYEKKSKAWRNKFPSVDTSSCHGFGVVGVKAIITKKC